MLMRVFGSLIGLAIMLVAHPSIAVAAGSSKSVVRGQQTIVVFGASYAGSWPIKNLDGMAVVNKGVGGDETHVMLARFDRDVLSVKPRAVLIWGFINDIHRSKPEELKDKLVRTRENIRSMIDKAQSKKIIPVLATEVTLPASQGIGAWLGKLRGKQSYQEYINAHVADTNQWIRSLAAEKKVALLDFEKALSGPDGARKQEYTTEDGTHLSPKAYEALTQYVQTKKLVGP